MSIIREIKKATGTAAVEKVLNTPKNFERRLKRRVGYYSAPMKFFRAAARIFKSLQK